MTYSLGAEVLLTATLMSIFSFFHILGLGT
jgi:hypothetical protein